MPNTKTDPAVVKARKLFEKSGKSLDELGKEMGLEGEVARRGAWQFLNKVNDPKISTLRLIAKAVGVSIEELVAEPRKRKGQSG